MNIVEKEALKFNERGFYKSARTLESLKSNLTTKLYGFNRERDRLDFLKILREKTISDKEEHAKNCSGCSYDETRNIALFSIDQEIDDINRLYSYEPKPEDKFSVEQESELHNKLNNILEKLEKQDFGQQIIFEEIEDLKNHFNLGKKNWFQLVKGKFVDLTISGVLEKTVVSEIYNQLSSGFEQVVKMIP